MNLVRSVLLMSHSGLMVALFRQCLVLGIVVACLLCPVMAGAQSWQVQAGDWSNPANWQGGVPTSNGIAYITNGGIATVTQSGEVCSYLYIDPEQYK